VIIGMADAMAPRAFPRSLSMTIGGDAVPVKRVRKGTGQKDGDDPAEKAPLAEDLIHATNRSLPSSQAGS
jgi:hypothetical protein